MLSLNIAKKPGSAADTSVIAPKAAERMMSRSWSVYSVIPLSWPKTGPGNRGLPPVELQAALRST
jgi:hypothetical protein